MNTKKKIAVLATIMSLGVVGWFGWQHFDAAPSVNDQAAGGERSAGASGPSGAATRGGGRQVVPRDNGVVIAAPVQSGQRVSTGDVLVQLDREAETIARDIAARSVEDASTLRDRRARLKRSQAGSQSDLDEAEAVQRLRCVTPH